MGGIIPLRAERAGQIRKNDWGVMIAMATTLSDFPDMGATPLAHRSCAREFGNRFSLRRAPAKSPIRPAAAPRVGGEGRAESPTHEIASSAPGNSKFRDIADS